MTLLWQTPKPAVLAAITVLEAAFGGYASVSAKLPARNRPARFVRVSRAGGAQNDPATDTARILVECFAKTVADAENMCNTARAALRNAAATSVGDGVFIRCWDNEQGPADLPHPDVLDYERWQFFGDLLVKAN